MSRQEAWRVRVSWWASGGLIVNGLDADVVYREVWLECYRFL
jgi:hypothetical protein